MSFLCFPEQEAKNTSKWHKSITDRKFQLMNGVGNLVKSQVDSIDSVLAATKNHSCNTGSGGNCNLACHKQTNLNEINVQLLFINGIMHSSINYPYLPPQKGFS